VLCVQGEPKQAPDGTLRTPGAVDFFRLLNEEMSIIEDISAGSVLYDAALAALRTMRSFMDTQLQVG
jgi:exocyst complex component 3